MLGPPGMSILVSWDGIFSKGIGEASYIDIQNINLGFLIQYTYYAYMYVFKNMYISVDLKAPTSDARVWLLHLAGL